MSEIPIFLGDPGMETVLRVLLSFLLLIVLA